MKALTAATAGLALASALSLLTGFTFADAWSAEDKAVLASLSLDRLPPTPRDASNAFADIPAAAALGKRLFTDTRFSRNQAVSCATCHAADRQFQDGLPVGKGVGSGSRRTMPIAGAAHGAWFFWDGRKDSLWSQALGPLEDGVEHGSNRTRIAALLMANYRSDFEALFGAMPDLSGLPADAGPNGTVAERAAWQSMPAHRRQDVNRVFANLGKVIAAYERTLSLGESRFDRYARAVVAGDSAGQAVLSAAEVRGLRLFIGPGQCATCHNGPLFTDQHFHNTGVPPRDAARPDPGRTAATDRVGRDEFNCLGDYSDAPKSACQELRFMASGDAASVGAFKTPGLRNVAQRAPYMHAGQFASLDEVIAHYVASPTAALGHSELAHERSGSAHRQPIRLTATQARDLAAFLQTLSGPIVEAPRPD
ncbi:cytochrome-c peroxidase [Rhizobacter sp. AJA081-3]|uniref:cytochrome-c peroxidase n=1 Tax=Rhizobacter sp. AJA081-3 TaxID=2753607 RepID=UPI001ADF56B8|nr:cytochrome c peroxidase [Rhizobacter sp. AJA081-3]QTN22135.1 cytochrome-c peroxidase [Rhizobacter sp. AJA081-3]